MTTDTNDHAPFYARSLMEKYADLAGVFETRSRPDYA